MLFLYQLLLSLKNCLQQFYQDAKDWANIVNTTTDLMYHHNDAGIDYTNDYNRNLDRKIAADRRLEDALLTLTSGLEIQSAEEIPSMQK